MIEEMEVNNMDAKHFINNKLDAEGIVILPEMEAKESMRLIAALNYRPAMTMLDPWYNRGTGGVRADYIPYILEIIDAIKNNTDHFFLWGFPEIAARFVDKVNKPLEFVTWITWFFKNCPSVIRGWRSSQQACLHFAIKEAKMYPENFFNTQQELRFENKKMRFVPGPNSVIEEPLLVGFVGKKEQTGHPSQKPEKVYEKLLLMTSKEGDLIYDPMAGSGTTGAVCKTHKRKCILSDISDEYLTLAENRLGIKRLPTNVIEEQLLSMSA
jgi:site-specific DNA-methyltransferase (adenine-specific)